MNPSPPTSRPEASATVLAARRLHAIATQPLPTEVRAAAADRLLDHFASCMAGLASPWALAISRYVASRAGAAEAFQWGSPTAVQAEAAAFGNAAIGHSVIRDDMHVASGSHIGVLVLPAALALAQRDGWSGAALLRGIVGGYEMATRLGVAIRTGGRTDHFRPSGINGPFGAAGAGIAGAGLDETVAASALGFAANACAGVNEWPWAGGQEIYTHVGMAARAGIAAVDLARAGMRSSPTALEGRDGLFAAYGAGKAGVDTFLAGLSDGHGIMETRHKPFAGCNLIQSPLAAALEVGRSMQGATKTVQTIVIRTFAQAQSYPGCDNSGPFQHVQQSKMSLQYGVASAILFGRVDEETFVRFDDPELQRLIALTRIEVVPEYQLSLARLEQPAQVEVRLADGRIISATVDDVPWLSSSEVEARFRAEADHLLSRADTDRLIRTVRDLDSLDSAQRLYEVLALTKAVRVGDLESQSR